jgi:hypothetical protein
MGRRKLRFLHRLISLDAYRRNYLHNIRDL